MLTTRGTSGLGARNLQLKQFTQRLESMILSANTLSQGALARFDTSLHATLAAHVAKVTCQLQRSCQLPLLVHQVGFSPQCD